MGGSWFAQSIHTEYSRDARMALTGEVMGVLHFVQWGGLYGVDIEVVGFRLIFPEVERAEECFRALGCGGMNSIFNCCSSAIPNITQMHCKTVP